MFLYFYLLEQAFFHKAMMPPLTQSLRRRSFVPCLELCRGLLSTNAAIPSDTLLHAVVAGVPFDRAFWHVLVGECLVHGAAEIPRLHTSPNSLCCLLAPERFGKPEDARSHYALIERAHFGTRDLVFGRGYYRPEHAGLNDASDVQRLAQYLETIDPALWKPADLTGLRDCDDHEQRAEELAFVRDWWPSLVELYQTARDCALVVVCEMV